MAEQSSESFVFEFIIRRAFCLRASLICEVLKIHPKMSKPTKNTVKNRVFGGGKRMHIAETPQAGPPRQSVALRIGKSRGNKETTPQGSRELPLTR